MSADGPLTDDPSRPHPVAPRSLRARALIAVALTGGFYGLAAVMVAGLLFAPYAALAYGHSGAIALQLVLVDLAALPAIFSAVRPRRTPFVVPGPRLEQPQQPRLFAFIDDVAHALRQTAPQDVYALADINAWVAEIDGRRVMGIGLPLMQALDCQQMRAVLAHELGHFDHGDTQLGPWIYRTRSGIGRALHGLRRQGRLLRLPFDWYGRTFLLVTQRISRQQELAADAVAARHFGVAALAGGLVRTQQAGVAYAVFWRDEVQPVLGAGFTPPLCAGFSRYLVSSAAQAMRGQSPPPSQASPYDSHPPLAQRLAALGTYGDAPAQPPALTLLDDVPALEREIWRAIGVDLQRHPPIEWAATSCVWPPLWNGWLARAGRVLTGISPATLPSAIGGIRDRFAAALPPREAEASTDAIVGAALAVALARAGWTHTTELGEPHRFVRGEQVLEPFRAAAALRGGTLTEESWRQMCADAGVADVDLGRLVDAAPARSAAPASTAPIQRARFGRPFALGMLLGLSTQVATFLLLAAPTHYLVEAAWRAAGPTATHAEMLAALLAAPAGRALIGVGLLVGSAATMLAGYLGARSLRKQPWRTGLITGLWLLLLHGVFRPDLHLVEAVRSADMASIVLGIVAGTGLGIRANAAPGGWTARLMAPVDRLGQRAMRVLRISLE